MTDLLNNLYPNYGDEEDSFEEFGGDSIDYSSHFVTDNIFDSDIEAIQWAKAVAISLGFELIISSHKKEGRVKVLICAHGGRYRGDSRDMELALRKNTKTQKCKCPFKVMAKKLRGVENWKIVAKAGKHGMHNHSKAVYRDGYRQMSGLSSASEKIVRDMTSAQAKPSCILAAIKEKNPDDNPNIRQVYNFRDAMRRESFEGRDVTTQFFHLAKEHNYVVYMKAGPTKNVITHLFMVHPESVKLLRRYYWYVGIDSTYKTNRYKMPFKQFVKAFEGLM